MDHVSGLTARNTWNGREMCAQNPKQFKIAPAPPETPFATPAPGDLEGDYPVGVVAGSQIFAFRKEDLSIPLTAVNGLPTMGKTLMMRRLMNHQLEEPGRPRLIILETQKTENLDLVCRPDTQYFDENLAHNPYYFLPPKTAQEQATAVSTMKADTFGQIPGSGGHLLQIAVVLDLYKRNGNLFTEADVCNELIRKYDKHEWRSDQGRLIARAIERSEQICSQLPASVSTTTSDLFLALATGKHILANFTQVQGPMLTYRQHTTLDAIYNFQRATMEAGHPAFRQTVVYVDEGSDLLSRRIDHHGGTPWICQLADIWRRYGMTLVLGTQEPCRLSRSVESLCIKVCFRLGSGRDCKEIGSQMMLSAEQTEMLATLQQQHCVVALGRCAPFLMKVLDTEIKEMEPAVAASFVPAKLIFTQNEIKRMRLGAVSGQPEQEVTALVPTGSAEAEQEKPVAAEPKITLSPVATAVLGVLAEELWNGRQQLIGQVGLPPNRVKAGLEELRTVRLITELKIRFKKTGRPRTVDVLTAKGWAVLSKDPKRVHDEFSRLEKERYKNQGFSSRLEWVNGKVQHDVAAFSLKTGELIAITEIVLTVHAGRLKAQLFAAVAAGAARISVLCCDGPDLQALNRSLRAMPAEVRDRVDVRSVGELIVQKL